MPLDDTRSQSALPQQLSLFNFAESISDDECRCRQCQPPKENHKPKEPLVCQEV